MSIMSLLNDARKRKSIDKNATNTHKNKTESILDYSFKLVQLYFSINNFTFDEVL